MKLYFAIIFALSVIFGLMNVYEQGRQAGFEEGLKADYTEK